MFKDKLKQLRTERNLTQADIAKAIGVSPATIGNYEQGTREPRNNEMWQKLAAYFDISVDELIDKSNIPSKRIVKIVKSDVLIMIDNLCKFRNDRPIIYNGVDITTLVHAKPGETIPITQEQRYADIEFISRSGHAIFARSKLLEIIYDIKKYSQQELEIKFPEIIEQVENNVIYWYKRCWIDMEDIFPKATDISTLYDLLNKCLAVDNLAIQEFYLLDIPDNFDWLREKLR